MTTNDTGFLDFENTYKYYAEEDHQRQALGYLYCSLNADTKNTYFEKYRAAPEPNGHTIQDVVYFSQHDNASGEGYRECFSSSCAMAAAYHGKVSTDDEYNAIRSRYGDSTHADAQIHALRYLGLEANFITNATIEELKELVRDNLPTPCGWLHNGPASSPSGGGHYSVVIGYDDDANQWVHNDPNGEANLVSGGYASHAPARGTYVRYSYQNWNRRMFVEGDGSGWLMKIRP